MRQPTVNVDVDGVIYDFVDDARQEFIHRYGAENVEAPANRSWRIWEHWRYRNDVETDGEWVTPGGNLFWRVVDVGVTAGRVFRTGRVYEGAVEGMKILNDSDYRVRIVTSKSLSNSELRYHAITNTLGMLLDHGIKYDDIAFVNGSKTQYEAQAVLDDKPAVLNWAQYGARNILFDQPWNQTIDWPGDPELVIHRVPGWYGALAVLGL